MLKVLIVEDDLIFAKDLAGMLEKHNCKVVGIANKYTKAIELFESAKPEFVFVDIELQGTKTGIDFANYMNGKARVPFIYLTRYYGSKYQEFFNKANDTNHYNFLTKLKVDEADIWHHVEVALDKFKRENNLLVEGAESSYVLRGFIYMKSKSSNTYQQIAINSIIYLESGRPYCTLYTANGSFHIRESLIKVLAFLQTPYIIQINAKHAVNINLVKEFSLTKNSLSIESKSSFKIGKDYKEKLKSQLPRPV
jgi:DNA-binding LytR/AlgR family response regulator